MRLRVCLPQSVMSALQRAAPALRRLSAASTGIRPPKCARPLSTRLGTGGLSELEPTALVFLRERGYADNVAEGVLKELTTNWGVAVGSELPMVEKLAGAWEIGADAGLDSLAKAVERELARTEGKAVVRFVVQGRSETVECQGFEGMSLKDVIDHGDDRGAQVCAASRIPRAARALTARCGGRC